MNFKTIIKLMDIKTLVAGIVPVILGSIYSKYAFGKLSIIYLILLSVAIIGELISILYACGPLPISYTPIGEVVSGITMGIGITTTVIYIHSGVFNLNTVLVAVPTSIFIGTILLSNNLSDIEEDRKVGRKTLPILIGIKNAEKLWTINVVMLLVLTFLLMLIRVYSVKEELRNISQAKTKDLCTVAKEG